MSESHLTLVISEKFYLPTAENFQEHTNDLWTTRGINIINVLCKPGKIKDCPQSALSHPLKCRYSVDGKPCLWTFTANCKRNRHELCHNNIGVFKCALCHATVKHWYNMYEHWRERCLAMAKFETRVFNLEIIKTRVLSILTEEGRENEYFAYGGMTFIPNEEFIKDISDRSEMINTIDCVLCSLTVPIKFSEAHAQAHRGYFRVDERVHSRYLCHICGFTFREKHHLYDHWTKNCPEVLAGIPQSGTAMFKHGRPLEMAKKIDFSQMLKIKLEVQAHMHEGIKLDSEELVAMVFLILQKSVPLITCKQMSQEDMEAVKRFAEEERKRCGLAEAEDLYHFPQEILPLVYEPDPIRDSELISSTKRELPISSVTDRINLFALGCPNFHSTHKAWLSYSDVTSNTVFRRVLHYFSKNSIARQYKITRNSVPVLDDKSKDDNWDNGFDRKCQICAHWFSNKGRLRHHINVVHQQMNGHCLICDTRTYSVNDLIDHWQKSCKPLNRWFNPEELKRLKPGRIRDFIFASITNVFSTKPAELESQMLELKTWALEADYPNDEDSMFEAPPKIAPKIKMIKIPKVPKVYDQQECCYCDCTVKRIIMNRHLITVHKFDKSNAAELLRIVDAYPDDKERRKRRLDLLLKTTKTDVDNNNNLKIEPKKKGPCYPVHVKRKNVQPKLTNNPEKVQSIEKDLNMDLNKDEEMIVDFEIEEGFVQAVLQFCDSLVEEAMEEGASSYEEIEKLDLIGEGVSEEMEEDGEGGAPFEYEYPMTFELENDFTKFPMAETYTSDGRLVIGGFWPKGALIDCGLLFPFAEQLKQGENFRIVISPVEKYGTVLMVRSRRDSEEMEPLIWPTRFLYLFEQYPELLPLCKEPLTNHSIN